LADDAGGPVSGVAAGIDAVGFRRALVGGFGSSRRITMKITVVRARTDAGPMRRTRRRFR
jgi:hypothetical protein